MLFRNNTATIYLLECRLATMTKVCKHPKEGINAMPLNVNKYR
jgi:hypothetical protein